MSLIHTNIPNLCKYANGYTANDAELETFFKSIPASAYCKDKNGKYLELNDLFVYTSSMSRAGDIIGKTDKDMPWDKEAPLMMGNDKKIIYQEESGIFIENAYCFGNQIRYFLSHKLPLLNRAGKKIGTIGASFLLDDIHIVSDWLKKSGFAFNVDPAKLLTAKKERELTQRQIDCLVCLVKGMSVKQIAKQLELSPKTVEHYLAAIRKKLHCNSRYELISKALQMPYIRESLLKL